MLKKAKWVKPSQANEPISRVAADVIRERLELVWDYAPLAAKKCEDDAEFLHQMRVATRRSAAALVTFADLMPPRKSHRMQKRLKRLRKASGEARDLDVLSDRLRQEMSSGNKSLSPIVERLCELRSDAQQQVVDAVDDLAVRDLARKINALCDRIRWRDDGDEPTYAVTARQLLCREVDNFAAAAGRDLSDSHSLHQLRIEGKQLRYTMEVLAGAFDSQFRNELYPQMRELQDKLGVINDHAVAQKRFLQWAEDSSSDLNEQFRQLARAEEQQSAQHRREFFNWWTDERKAALEAKLRSAMMTPQPT